MYIEGKEALNELKRMKNYNQRILEDLVIERIKYKHENYFYITELNEWCKYFNIDIERMIRSILMIEEEEYFKITKKHITRIKSKRYDSIKNKILKMKRNEYKRKMNLNRRNYFNKTKIKEDASRLCINEVDFVIHILKKSRGSMRIVMNDSYGRKRLYVGKYVNCALPMLYYNNNLEKINDIIRKAIGKIIRKLNMRYNKEEYEEMVQSSNLYLMENGNGLDKYMHPLIREDDVEIKKRDSKMFYNKIYFFQLNQVNSNKLRSIEYDDNKRIEKDLTQETEIEDMFSKLFPNKEERRIYRKLLKYREIPNKIEKIALEERMSVEKVKKIVNEGRELYRSNKLITAQYD